MVLHHLFTVDLMSIRAREYGPTANDAIMKKQLSGLQIAENVPITIHFAAWTGNTNWLSSQLENGVNILRGNEEEEDYTALYLAMANMHTEIVLMTSKVADRIKAWDSIFRHFPKLVQMAARNDDIVTLRLFLERGADCSKRIGHNDWTPLHIATNKGNKRAIELLLAYGVDVTAQTRDGTMAIHLAAQNGSEDSIRPSVKGGMDISAYTLSYSRMSLAVHKGLPNSIRTSKMWGVM
jgi:hypothetical protein